MDKVAKIKEAFKGLNEKGHYASSAFITGTCKSIDGIASIDVDVDGITYHDVQLQAIADGSGKSIIIVPAKDSNVLIGNIEHSTGYVLIKADKADRILIMQADGMYIDVLKKVIKLNGDSEGGLVKIQELQDNLDSLKSFVEAINNALPSAFNAILPTAPAPFVATGALGATTYQASMVGKFINFKEMENKKVKHGK